MKTKPTFALIISVTCLILAQTVLSAIETDTKHKIVFKNQTNEPIILSFKDLMGTSFSLILNQSTNSKQYEFSAAGDRDPIKITIDKIGDTKIMESNNKIEFQTNISDQKNWPLKLQSNDNKVSYDLTVELEKPKPQSSSNIGVLPGSKDKSFIIILTKLKKNQS